jgi:hypothetical protein
MYKFDYQEYSKKMDESKYKIGDKVEFTGVYFGEEIATTGEVTGYYPEFGNYAVRFDHPKFGEIILANIKEENIEMTTSQNYKDYEEQMQSCTDYAVLTQVEGILNGCTPEFEYQYNQTRVLNIFISPLTEQEKQMALKATKEHKCKIGMVSSIKNSYTVKLRDNSLEWRVI